MKKDLPAGLKIALQTTGTFLLGFIPFYAVFDPYWVAIALGREFVFPNIVGAFVGAIFIAAPLFLPYFFIIGNFAILKTRFTKKKSKRVFIYFLALSPFLIFNLLAYLLVAGDWTGPEYFLGNHVLFLLGLFFIILPSTGAFIYFNERYYKQCQGE